MYFELSPFSMLSALPTFPSSGVLPSVDLSVFFRFEPMHCLSSASEKISNNLPEVFAVIFSERLTKSNAGPKYVEPLNLLRTMIYRP